MLRRRLWEVDCVLRDTILHSSFTRDELEALVQAGTDEAEEGDGDAPCERSFRVTRWAHELTGDANPLSERLDETLSETHDRALALVATFAPGEVLAWIRGDLGSIPISLPAMIWAVAVDPRPCMAAIRGCLLSRLLTEGVRVLAFGKVEVIHV
jgi:hypothetical protein